MQVLCIDAGNAKKCIAMRMIPLREGEVYTIRGENEFTKGEGYLLQEIINETFSVNGQEPSYLKSRFIPVSDIDEIDQRKVDLIELQEYN